MASYRIGIGSFNLKDGAVGIGTESSGLGNLKVEGTIKTTDLDVGVSTFTRYSGFEGEETKFDKDVTLSGEYSTTGDIVVESGATLTVGLGSTACIGSVECISVKHHFSVPVGDIAGRNKSSGYAEGTVRYNRDLGTMEFFNGNEWRQFTYISDIKTNPQGRGRGIIAGGETPNQPSSNSTISFVTVSSLGNSLNFGDLTTGARYSGASAANSTRGMIMGGWNGPANDFDIDYITMASEGNGIDFGENTTGGFGAQGASDSVRAIAAGGGYPSASATIDMFFFSTVGSKTDFGDITATRFRGPSAACSPVRGIFTGGYGPTVNTLDTKLLASSADTTEFGTLANDGRGMTCISNHTRGVITGDYQSNITNMDFLTITSTGTMSFFGDLTVARNAIASIQNTVRGIFAGGRVSPARFNVMDFITISSAGNAQDFGDLTKPIEQAVGICDSHGGLGGY